MNKVFLSGNFTRDPEVRYTQSGKAFARMGIAVRRPFSKDKDAVDFFNLIAWDKTAEFCKRYFMKGSRALVEGRLQTSSYENKDGVKVNSVDIVIESIEFADSKRQSTGGEDNYPSAHSANTDYSNNRETTPSKDFVGEPIDDGDYPF